MRRLQTRQIKMEVFTLLLVVLTVSGHSYVLQPRLTAAAITGPDGEQQSERDVSLSVEKKKAESTERRKTEEEQRSDGLTLETNPEEKRTEIKIIAEFMKNTERILDINKGYEKDSEERLESKNSGDRKDREEFSVAESKTVKEILTGKTKNTQSPFTWIQEKPKDDGTHKKSGQMDKLRQEMEKEEKESKLVAGIHLHEETRAEAHEKTSTINRENMEVNGRSEEGETGAGEGKTIKNANRNDLGESEKEDQKEDQKVVSELTPSLSTSSTLQAFTQSQNSFRSYPPPPPPPPPHYNVPPSLSVTPRQGPPVSPHFPSSITLPNPPTISHISVSATPGEVRSEDLTTEVFPSPGHHLKQNKLEVKASPSLEDVMAQKRSFKLAQKATKEINSEFTPKVQAATRRHKEANFTTKDSKTKEPNSKKSNENNSTATPAELKPNMTQLTRKPTTVKLKENDPKLTVKPNKETPPSAKTPSTRPKKTSTSSKNKTVLTSKEKKRKKNNKTQKPPEKKKVIVPTHFPYFLDDYCPPECACYGRVVQCSDKGVDKIPYGIPYNSRYILLMNNRIDSIQLDLLNEYVSMEFLVLSNNQLTDGAIEGAFEGIPALKRLYLDRNLLESVPTDLPDSLEELRLDNNHLSVMSKAAWARCPGLLVLSLSNNSLGNGSDSLPNAMLSPLSSLRTLNLDHNQLTSVPIGLPLSIKELYLKGNLIEHFRSGAFNGTSELVVLDLSANRLTNKGLLRDSLLNATHLESLNLEGNRLKQVPRHLPRSLKTLNLEGNLISSIKKAALSTLENLEHLGLARNKIFKVAPGAFKALPALHQLDLCHNTLRQVPRQLPQALHSVVLTHNKIQLVPRDAFCWGNRSISGLVQVQLEHNLIDMGKLDAQAFRCLRGFQVVHFY